MQYRLLFDVLPTVAVAVYETAVLVADYGLAVAAESAVVGSGFAAAVGSADIAVVADAALAEVD